MSVNISIITVFPELYTDFLNTSLLARAQQEGRVRIAVHSFASVCAPKERIDEPTCGPGAGMVIKPDVVERVIAKAEQGFGPAYKIFFSPQGTRLQQTLLRELATRLAPENAEVTNSNEVAPESSQHILLMCPRYEGIDARVEAAYADLVLSIGDYVLMGGDLAAQVFLESFLRLIPGVVGKQESVEQDSFSGPFLDYPAYGLPLEWHGQSVPAIVTSGNHGAIAGWRQQEAAYQTVLKRFDWLRSQVVSEHEKQLTYKSIPAHYVVLMHSEVLVEDGKVGCSSVTSIDLHDIARSSATYGFKGFFPVTPLEDQLLIVHQFLQFWDSEEGMRYNPSRARATRLIAPKRTLDEVVAAITEQEGVAPLLVATSAKAEAMGKADARIDYYSQGKVWQHERPVLIILGTGKGLAPQVLARCDYLLIPVKGLTDYNHLSVRSAAAIIFDRWLGLNQQLGTLLLEKSAK